MMARCSSGSPTRCLGATTVAVLAAGLAGILAASPQAPSPGASADMQPYSETIPGSQVSFEMVPIPGGSFRMGSVETEAGRSGDEGPQHAVTIRPFWMGRTEVTWDEYDLFALAVPRKVKGAPCGAGGRRCDHASHDPLHGRVVRVWEGAPAGDLDDSPRGHGVLPLDLAEDRQSVQVAHRGRVGIRMPRRDRHGLLVRRGKRGPRRVRVVRAELREAAASRGREEAEPVGPARHARQRGRVVPRRAQEGRVQALRQGASRRGAGRRPRCDALPSRRPGGGRGGTPPRSCARLLETRSGEGWNEDAKHYTPSIWWHTDAAFVGFRVVRALDEQDDLKGLRSRVTKDSP